MLWYESYDLQNIYTPIDAEKFGNLLSEAGYDPAKTQFIYQGFKNGFPLNYQGETNVKRRSRNLPLNVGNKTDLWNKIMKEVRDKRVAGPYTEILFDTYIQSPVGLVPKDQGRKTQLIFHLSHPKNGDSVNSAIPAEMCFVQYQDFTQAIILCLQCGKTCVMGKSDLSSAFRHAPLSRKDWRYLLMMAEHPITKRTYFFVDKCLPFGSSISCANFQAISDAISFVVTFRTKKSNVNYLDDFLFAAICKALCDSQIQVFLDVCAEIKFPVSMEKTVWGFWDSSWMPGISWCVSLWKNYKRPTN